MITPLPPAKIAASLTSCEAGRPELAAHDTFDVLVIGGGGSGLAAAVSAAENGCRVLLLEKQPQLPDCRLEETVFVKVLAVHTEDLGSCLERAAVDADLEPQREQLATRLLVNELP